MNWNPKYRSKYKWVVYRHLPTNKEITMNKPIIMMELKAIVVVTKYFMKVGVENEKKIHI
jgi:hypothetical protein